MKFTIVLVLTLATLAVGQIGHDKAAILDRGHKLLNAAEKGMAELVKWGKSYDTTVLKQALPQLRKLIAELEAATDPSAITRIGEETNKVEHTISNEITKINYVVNGPPDF